MPFSARALMFAGHFLIVFMLSIYLILMVFYIILWLIGLVRPGFGFINSPRVTVVVEAQAYNRRWNASRCQNLRLKR